MHTVHCKGSPTKGTKSKAATSPLPSRGSPTPNAGQKSELAASAMPSRGPKTRRSCYATPAFSRVPDAKRGDKITSGSLALAFSGVPNKGHEIRRGYLTPPLSGGQKRVELLRKPRILGGPQRQTRGQNQKWLPHPCLIGAPKEGGVAMHTVRCRGSPTKGTKSEAATSHLPSRGSPTPNAGQKSELATSPVLSRGPKRGRTRHATLAFSRVPDAKHGDKITSGSLTLPFSGGQKRAELLCNP